MEAAKKAERVQLLITLGNEVLGELLERHVADGADPLEIVFRGDKIPELVEEYDEHLEEYRSKHIGSGNLVDGDKIAALTGTLIMRHWIFESATKKVSTPFAEFANETFAVRMVQLFVRRETPKLNPPDHVQLMFCFGQSCNCDKSMLTWVIATMTQFLKWGCVKDPEWAD